MSNLRFLTLASIIAAAAASRLLPHPPNFTPIGAMALFGGATLGARWAAFAVPCAAMYLSDLALGFFIYDFGFFHSGMPFVYASFMLTVCVGLWLGSSRSTVMIGGAVALSTLLFFIVTNFGVWSMGHFYPKTLGGLIACYSAGIPFALNTLAGDAFYALVLFGGFAVAQNRLYRLREGAHTA